LNPNNVATIWDFAAPWEAGFSFGRFGDENLAHHPTDFTQDGGESPEAGVDPLGPLYFPMYGTYSGTNLPTPGNGSLDDWADAIRTALKTNDDLTRLGSAKKTTLNYRVDSNSWRADDGLESGLDNWVEVSMGYVRIKNFKASDIKAGKVNVEGDFQLELQGTDAPSRMFVQGTFTIDHITEVTAYNPTLEDVKMEENKTPTCE
jgi:hypothetical protein